MSLVELDWSIPLLEVGAIYASLGDAFNDAHEPLSQAVDEIYRPAIAHNFAVGGDPPWEALTDATMQTRVSGGYGVGPILVRTGELEAVATSAEAWEITAEDAQLINLADAAYGVFHEFGTSMMPARPWAESSDPEGDGDASLAIYDKWIGDKLVEHGFV